MINHFIMTNTSTKNYIKGSAKSVATKYAPILNLSLKLADLAQIVNEKGYVNVSVFQREHTSPYWETHYVIANDFKPSTPTV